MRNAIHVFVSLLMWCLFGYYWYVVSQNQLNQASLQAVGILAIIVVVGLGLTLWWVAHNKKLAQRNRRTSAPATVPETFDFDFLGRPLDRPSVDALKAAQVIEVVLGPGRDGQDQELGRKVYSVVPGEVK